MATHTVPSSVARCLIFIQYRPASSRVQQFNLLSTSSLPLIYTPSPPVTSWMLITPASNSQSCVVEIAQVELWAREKNLSLNRTKSVEIVFVSPPSNRDLVIPPPAVPEIERAEPLKVLGVTFNRKFSVSQHIDNVLGACAQTLFAIRTLRYHGLPEDAIYAVYQAVVDRCQADLCFTSLVGIH